MARYGNLIDLGPDTTPLDADAFTTYIWKITADGKPHVDDLPHINEFIFNEPCRCSW